MKTKELIKYFYGDLISQPRVFILMKSVNFAVQVMKSYYVLVHISIRNPSKYEIILY